MPKKEAQQYPLRKIKQRCCYERVVAKGIQQATIAFEPGAVESAEEDRHTPCATRLSMLLPAVPSSMNTFHESLCLMYPFHGNLDESL